MAHDEGNHPDETGPETSDDSTGGAAAGEDTPGGSSDLLAQDELDALIAAFEEKERRARDGDDTSHAVASEGQTDEADEIPSVTPDDDSDAGSVEPALDESGRDLGVINDTDAEIERAPEPKSSATLTQSDIEALIQQATGESDDETEEEGDESETDADLIAESAGTDAEETLAETPSEGDGDGGTFEEAADEAGELEQVLQNLSAAASGEGEGRGEEAEAAASTADEDAPSIEASLAGIAEAAEEPVLDEPGAGDASLDEALDDSAAPAQENVNQDAEAVLDAANPDEPLAGQDMEEVLAEVETPGTEEAEPTEPGETDDVAEVTAARAGGAEPAASTVTDTTVIEEIGSENVAAGAADAAGNFAGAAAESQPESGPAEASAAADELPQAEAEEEGAPVGGRRWLPPSVIELAREEPLRAVAGLAAGLIVAATTFAFLYTNQLRPASVADLAPEGAGVLEQAMNTATTLIGVGDYAEAAEVLDEALAASPETAERFDDARFLRLEAMYRGMPERISTARANRMHVAIDEVVETARGHPRAAEALMWKADVYEREGNPVAARAEYRSLLDTFGNASNRDEVLLRLGRVELATERPLQAVRYLQRLIQTHPESKHVGRARLLLGDAYAAAGDSDNARVMYIRLAEASMDSALGAEAFSRLGELALDAGEPGAAIRELESRLESATTVEGNDRVYLILARAYRADGEPEKARNILNELIDFFPESEVTPLALVELTQVLADLGLESESARMASRAVERYPNHPEVLENAGRIFKKVDDSEAAGRSMLAAYEAGAEEPGILLSAGDYLLESGAYDAAQEAYERLILDHPASSDAVEGNIGWAKAAEAKGDVEAAYRRLTDLSLALEGRPRQVPVLRALGELYGELGLEREMVAAYGQVAAVSNDPGALAEASRRLMEAGAVDEGLKVAARVDAAKLPPGEAYRFLMARGRALLRRDAEEALALMKHAHETYADYRSAEGVRTLLEAALARGKTAYARELVSELQTRVAQAEHRDERPLLEQAAATYGDFLYRRGDFQAAAQAYGIALGGQPGLQEAPPLPESAAGLSDVQVWSLYQRANALIAMERYDESLALYELVATSGSAWSEEAKTRAQSARLEQRLEGEARTALREAS